jgi:hypothetical protein
MDAEISYYDRVSDGGVFRLPNEEWRFFIIVWDSSDEASLEPENWDITSAILHCPESAPRTRASVEHFLGITLRVANWREVPRPSADNLAALQISKKCKQFQAAIPTFVNRRGLYMEDHEVCLVQVSDIQTDEQAMTTTVTAVSDVPWVAKLTIIRRVGEPEVAYL